MRFVALNREKDYADVGIRGQHMQLGFIKSMISRSCRWHQKTVRWGVACLAYSNSRWSESWRPSSWEKREKRVSLN